jgi:hypothetical protein
MIRCSQIDETRWLLAINCLIQMTMKKCILDIQLMNGLGTRGSNAENNLDRGRFNNWTECLVVVNVVPLRKSTNNPSSFVTSKRAIIMMFMLEYPLETTLAWGSKGMRCQVPLSTRALYSYTITVDQLGSASVL